MSWMIAACFTALFAAFGGYCYILGFDPETVKAGKPVFRDVRKGLLILMAAAWVVSVLMSVYSRHFGLASGMQLVVHAVTLLWLVTIAWLDHHHRLIPNQLIVVGLVLWLIFAVIELVFARTPVRQLLLYSGAGLLMSVMLWVIALISRGAFGMGDVKLFAVLGLFYGLSGTFAILFFTSLIMAVLAVILLATKKATRKSALPMAPFVVIGFIIAIAMGI